MYSPNYAPSEMTTEQATRFVQRWRGFEELSSYLPWHEGPYKDPHGYPEDVYRYWISRWQEGVERDTTHIFLRHHFLHQLRWYVMIAVSPNVADMLVR